MKSIDRSVINRAAMVLINDPSKWDILVDCDAARVRAVRNAVQDYRYAGAHLDSVGTVLAFCIGYSIISEDK